MKKALFITVLLLACLVGCSRVPEAEVEENIQIDSLVEIPTSTPQTPIECEAIDDELLNDQKESSVQSETVESAPKALPEEEALPSQAEEIMEQLPEVDTIPQGDSPICNVESPIVESPAPTPELTSTPQSEQPAEEQETIDTDELEAEVPVEEAKEVIDPNAIAAYARSYAASLGFVIDTSLGQGNSGYYPPEYRPINTMQDGYNAAVGLVAATKNQLNSRFSAEHSGVLVDEAYGLVRANCQVIFSHSDLAGDWYYIYVYYG